MTTLKLKMIKGATVNTVIRLVKVAATYAVTVETIAVVDTAIPTKKIIGGSTRYSVAAMIFAANAR